MKNLDSSIKKILAPLELEVLEEIWPKKRLLVKDVYSKLKKRKKKVALTSVAVILNRLYEKGIVGREIDEGKTGLRYRYFPKKSKKEFGESVLEQTVNSLIDKFGPVATSYFDERFSRRKKRWTI